MDKKIWLLFSVKNDYDQPDNNLFAWWGEKPSLEVLSDILTERPLAQNDDETIINIVKLHGGLDIRMHHDTTFRLEERGPGIVEQDNE